MSASLAAAVAQFRADIRAGVPARDSLLRAVDEALSLPIPEAPGPEEARRAIRGIMRVREWDKGIVRPLAGYRARAGAPDCARALGDWLRWHAGGGNLHGAFSACFWGNPGTDTVGGRMNTLAAVLRTIAGASSSPALDAWKRAGVIR